MSTFSYDFTEAGDFGDFVTLTPGRYVFEFIKIEAGQSAAKNPKAIVTLKVAAVEGGAAEIYIGGVINQHWPTTGAGAGRFQSFIKALGIKSKERGKVNLAQKYGEEIGAIVELEQGKELRDDGSPMFFHNLKAIHPGAQYRAMMDLEDEDEPDGPEEDEEPEDDEGEDEPWTAEDFEGITLADLKQIAEDNDISIEPDAGKSKLSAAAMRARLIEALVDEDEDEDDEDDEDEEEDEDEWTDEDIDGLSLTELQELAEEWEVSTKPAKGKKVASAALLRKRLKDALEAEDDEDGEDEEPF